MDLNFNISKTMKVYILDLEYIEEEDEFDFKPNNKNSFNKKIDFGVQK